MSKKVFTPKYLVVENDYLQIMIDHEQRVGHVYVAEVLQKLRKRSMQHFKNDLTENEQKLVKELNFINKDENE